MCFVELIPPQRIGPADLIASSYALGEKQEPLANSFQTDWLSRRSVVSKATYYQLFKDVQFLMRKHGSFLLLVT